MRRGAALRLVLPAGGVVPRFCVHTCSQSNPRALTHPKIEKNENLWATGPKIGYALASRCYIS